jgi:hypothetical protein
MLLLQFGLFVGMVNGNAIANTVSRRQQGVMLKLTVTISSKFKLYQVY